MNSGVKVNTRENKDLVRKLKKHRRIALLNDSKLLKLASPVRKVFSILFKIFTAFLIVFAGLFVYSIINARRNGVVPRFAGISLEQVATGSMVASGLDVGTNVLVYKVDPHTLKVGDIIAFYAYSADYARYNETNCSTVYQNAKLSPRYSVAFDDFLGKIDQGFLAASRVKSKLVIHHIVNIEQDDTTGEWWFETKGSSNSSKDTWHISEKMIVGYYNQSQLTNFFGKILNFITTFAGIMVIVGVPLVFLVFIVITTIFNNAQLGLLEAEVLEGVRPVSDPVCVKNKIGKNLSKQDKFYLLATTKEEDRANILPYLYDDGAVPNAINKYYLRKKLMMMPIYEMKSLQYKAQQQYNSGVSLAKVMKEYERGKEELLNKHENYRQMFKAKDKEKFPYESMREKIKNKKSKNKTKSKINNVESKKNTTVKTKTKNSVKLDSKNEPAENKSSKSKLEVEKPKNNVTKKDVEFKKPKTKSSVKSTKETKSTLKKSTKKN